MTSARIVTALATLAWLAPAAPASAQVVTVLKSFTGGSFGGPPGDGAGPTGSLLPYDGMLYRMAATGGNFGEGVIFRMGMDGTGYTVLRSFQSQATDGGTPLGSLTQFGGNLYGMTEAGGTMSGGTIFRIAPDGTGFTVVHSFAAGPTDGSGPAGSLALSGTIFYGTTPSGGTVQNGDNLYQYGTVFKTNTDGTGYTLLHSFGTPGDGASPEYGSLVVSGSTIYGTTFAGGANSFGTVYKINTDGTGYKIIHAFGGAANDGGEPFGSVIQVGSNLYGMTKFGGTSGAGAIYRIGIDGSNFTLLRSLYTTPTDAANPQDELLLGSDGRLYGMTTYGGANALGTLFGINLDGTGYTVYHSFAGMPTDGASPYTDDLVEIGTTFYGMTGKGGANDYGTIFMFSTSVPEPSSLLLGAAAAAGLLARIRLKQQKLQKSFSHRR